MCSCEDNDEEDRVPDVEDLPLSNPHMSRARGAWAARGAIQGGDCLGCWEGRGTSDLGLKGWWQADHVPGLLFKNDCHCSGDKDRSLPWL